MKKILSLLLASLMCLSMIGSAFASEFKFTYKCMVTDAEGNQVTSEVITITVDSESSGGRVSIPTSGKTGYLD